MENLCPFICLSHLCLVYFYRTALKALKARTFFLHARVKGHACYWYRLSGIYRQKTVQVQITPFIVKFLTIRSIGSIGIEVFRNYIWISFVTDIKQTCLRQGLGVAITAKKRPSKLMFTMKDLGHTLPGHPLVPQN